MMMIIYIINDNVNNNDIDKNKNDNKINYC